LGIEVPAGDIYLTTEPLRGGGLINDREARRRAAEVFKVMEVDIDPGAVLGNLSTAFWQLTEIAKALAQDAQVLIMDEPTASLAKHETEHLFQLVERLKARESRSSTSRTGWTRSTGSPIGSPSCATANDSSPNR
jgi:ribose transport system ATP-binding protein